MSELVLCETRGAVALLTLNRPEKLNALNYALVDRIKERLDTIEGAADIRAVILTGAGDRAFSAGADITEFSETLREGPDAAVRAFVRRGQSMTARTGPQYRTRRAGAGKQSLGGGSPVGRRERARGCDRSKRGHGGQAGPPLRRPFDYRRGYGRARFQAPCQARHREIDIPSPASQI